jgi:hypothetical protein
MKTLIKKLGTVVKEVLTYLSADFNSAKGVDTLLAIVLATVWAEVAWDTVFHGRPDRADIVILVVIYTLNGLIQLIDWYLAHKTRKTEL